MNKLHRPFDSRGMAMMALLIILLLLTSCGTGDPKPDPCRIKGQTLNRVLGTCS